MPSLTLVYTQSFEQTRRLARALHDQHAVQQVDQLEDHLRTDPTVRRSEVLRALINLSDELQERLDAHDQS